MIDYCPSQHTPFDDEPDAIEEAERFLKQYDDGDERNLQWAADIIAALLEEI